MRKLWPGLLALVAVAAFGLLNLDRLPEQLATHWNLSGQVDGWTAKRFAVVTLPGIGIAVAILLSWLPTLDPKRANFPQFADVWWLVGNLVLLFMAGLQFFVVGVGLGWNVSMDRVSGFAVGGVLLVLGNYLTRVRQNWFLGIRTPWTLSSEKSWRQTHRLGGWMFAAGGLLLLAVTAVTGRMAVWALVAGAGLPALISLVYSYIVWRDDPEAGAKPESSAVS